MRKILLSIVPALLFCAAAVAQQGQQTSWWYFGVNAGVHFNTAPTAVTNGQVSTSEGVATIADPNANLLFYSDGIRVWNSNHAVMTNGTGLLGSGTSAQSGVTVLKPGSTTEYFLFTVAPFGSANGLRYSLIDMTQSSGLGAVVNAQKNVWLMANNTEKIAVIPKTGGFWVMCPKANSDTMYAFEVTSAGVNLNPVTSSTGVYTGNPQGSVSYLKPNLQGTRMVGGCYNSNVVALYDFNRNTGVTSNGFTFTAGTTTHANYGVEFSPNGNLVYAQGWGSADCRQYDITSGNATTISNSVINLGPSGSGQGGGGGAIQLGRDGKMYVCRFGQTYLDRITNPDTYGTGAGYTTQAVNLNGRQCRWGLPTFIQAYFGASIVAEHYCFGDSTILTADTNNVDSLYWDFGDPNSGNSNTTWGFSTGHIYTDTGTFTVTLVAFGNNGLTDTTSQDIYIYPYPTANLGADTSLCYGLEFVVDQTQPFADYLWHDGSTDSSYTVTSPDSTVWVEISSICDTIRDTLNVNYYYPFVVDVGPDTSMCTYDNFTLNTNLSSPLLFNWSTGGSQPTQYVGDTGTYSVTVTDGYCTYADTVTIDFYPEVAIDLGHDSAFCYQTSAELVPKTVNNINTLEWSTGSTSSSVTVTQSGMYTVTATGVGGFCHAIDSVQWSLYFEPTVDFGGDKLFCHNEDLTLDPAVTDGGLPVEFLWNDNSGQPTLITNLVGMYWVEVSDENCAIRDTVNVDIHPVLDVGLGEDLKACEGSSKTLVPATTQPVTTYAWSDGSSGSTLKINQHGTYMVTVYDANCKATDEVNVFYYEYPDVNLGNDTLICPNEELHFDVTQESPIAEYLWFDGATGARNIISPANYYEFWVQVTNEVCVTVDSIYVRKREVPEIKLGRDTAICEGDKIELTVGEDQRIIGTDWNTGDTSTSVIVAQEGEIEVLVRDKYCETPAKIKVTFRPEPTPDDLELDLPETICIGEEFYVDVNHPLFNAYQWQDGSTSSNYTVNSEGLYWVKATHDCGVIADSVLIEPCECPVWLPNAFNPDGDGNNDKFVPTSECEFADYRFSIFDRWGEQVFYTEDPTESWNGMRGSEKAQIGAYSYRLFYTAIHEGEEIESTRNGTVVLLR